MNIRYFFAITILAISSLTLALDIESNSYLLLDIHSDTILKEKQANLKLPPASITKIMTAYIVFSQIKSKNINLTDIVLISKHAANKRGSRMFIREGSMVSVNDLLHGMIIASGNDASIALAEYISGSEESFAELMNKTAITLKMTNTHFTNSTGWPDSNHYTTAHDIALMTKALIIDFPELYKIFKQKVFTYGQANNGTPIVQHNRNGLLWANDIKVDGVKTGHTEIAGYCLVASAVYSDMRLVSVVMKTNSKKARIGESKKLLNYGIKNFHTKKILNKNQAYITAPIWKGHKDKIKIGVTKDIFVTVPKSLVGKIESKIKVNKKIIAPIKTNTQVGEISFFIGDKLISTEPLSAVESVESGGFFNNLLDSIMLFMS